MTKKHTRTPVNPLSDEEVMALSRIQFSKNITPYSDEEISELSNSASLLQEIENLKKQLSSSKIDFNKIFNIPNKAAYPNIDHYMHVPGQHNTDKWLQAIKDLYYKENNGELRVNAINEVTQGWNPNETYDFLNWLKFYEGGNHLKYKVAQTWYTNDSPGYFLKIDPDNNNMVYVTSTANNNVYKITSAGVVSIHSITLPGPSAIIFVQFGSLYIGIGGTIAAFAG